MLDLAQDGSRRGRPLARLHRAMAAAALLGAGALAASCNLLIGSGDYKVGEGACTDCPCGGFAFAAAACGTCASTSCCDEGAHCRADKACAALYDCLAACTDAHCRNQCAADHPAGDDAPAQALEACLAKSATCGDACTTCGGYADWYADTCGACVASTCCEQAKACADDDVCAERERCYRACTYPSCPIDCDAHVAASAPAMATTDAIAALDTCVSKGCGKPCDYGAHWSCVGAFTWPASTPGANVTFTVRATSFATAQPFPAATIRACARADLGCTNPLDSKVTGADGVAALTVPSGFNGYFDATADSTLESLVFVTWPLTTSTSYDLQLGPYDLYKQLVMSGGGQVDDTKGALFVYTEDCLGNGAPDVQLSISPAGTSDQFYFVNGSPVATEDHTAADAIGGFANVDPGTITLKAKLATTSQDLALFTALVRTQTLTYVSLTPTP